MTKEQWTVVGLLAIILVLELALQPALQGWLSNLANYFKTANTMPGASAENTAQQVALDQQLFNPTTTQGQVNQLKAGMLPNQTVVQGYPSWIQQVLGGFFSNLSKSTTPQQRTTVTRQ